MFTKLTKFSLGTYYSEIFDEDLLVEILQRLPPKSLCRFRCVCKSWNCLISSPSFISTHHSFISSTIPANRKTYLVKEYNRQAFYHPQDLVQHVRYFGVVVFRVGDFTISSDSMDFIGVIHGLVCATLEESIPYSLKAILLWNPAIHKYLVLPSLSSIKDYTIGLGFGYDSSKNDFKVVRVSTPFVYDNIRGRSLPTSTLYEVYSSREGLWREKTVDNIGSFRFINKTGCFINGTVHWLVSRNTQDTYKMNATYSLLMFDCQTEQFRTMELQKIVLGPFVSAQDIIKYSGMLSVLLKSNSESPDLELWAMEEHDDHGSRTWKKLCSTIVKANELGKNVVLMREDGDIYLPRDSGNMLGWYDPNRWIKIRGVKRFYQPLNGHVYEETMFLMDDARAMSCTPLILLRDIYTSYLICHTY